MKFLKCRNNSSLLFIQIPQSRIHNSSYIPQLILQALQRRALSQQQLEKIVIEQLQIQDQTKLSTAKRRIYDATNALHSIGLIKKNSQKEYIFVGFISRDKLKESNQNNNKTHHTESHDTAQYFETSSIQLDQQNKSIQKEDKQEQISQISMPFTALITNQIPEINQFNESDNKIKTQVVFPNDEFTLISDEEIVTALKYGN